MSAEQPSNTERGIECPSCGCRHLYVLYTRHRGRAIVRVRTCRHCSRRIVTHERVAGTEGAKPSQRATNL
jgi:transcriptional regulator NrdR family protein